MINVFSQINLEFILTNKKFVTKCYSQKTKGKISELKELNYVGTEQNFTIKIHVYTSSGQFYLTNESTWQKILSWRHVLI